MDALGVSIEQQARLYLDLYLLMALHAVSSKQRSMAIMLPLLIPGKPVKTWGINNGISYQTNP